MVLLGVLFFDNPIVDESFKDGLSWRVEEDVSVRICNVGVAVSEVADDSCQVGSRVVDQGVGDGFSEFVDGFDSIVGVEVGQLGDGDQIECRTWDL